MGCCICAGGEQNVSVVVFGPFLVVARLQANACDVDSENGQNITYGSVIAKMLCYIRHGPIPNLCASLVGSLLDMTQKSIDNLTNLSAAPRFKGDDISMDAYCNRRFLPAVSPPDVVAVEHV